MTPELRADRAQALTVPCPYPRCLAATGDPCRNPDTGRPVASLAAHLSRLKAAGVSHAPLSAEVLAGDAWDPVASLRQGSHTHTHHEDPR